MRCRSLVCVARVVVVEVVAVEVVAVATVVFAPSHPHAHSHRSSYYHSPTFERVFVQPEEPNMEDEQVHVCVPYVHRASPDPFLAYLQAKFTTFGMNISPWGPRHYGTPVIARDLTSDPGELSLLEGFQQLGGHLVSAREPGALHVGPNDRFVVLPGATTTLIHEQSMYQTVDAIRQRPMN